MIQKSAMIAAKGDAMKAKEHLQVDSTQVTVVQKSGVVAAKVDAMKAREHM